MIMIRDSYITIFTLRSKKYAIDFFDDVNMSYIGKCSHLPCRKHKATCSRSQEYTYVGRKLNSMQTEIII